MDIRKEIAVIDLGTSKICCAVARKIQKSSSSTSESPSNISEGREIRVLGVGYQLAKGIKKYALSNLEDLEDSILNSILTAEKDAQKSIRSVYISIPSWAIESLTVETSIDIGQVPVDDVHINALLDFDTSKYINPLKQVIHIFPISYSLDSVAGIQDPMGMIGEKLVAKLYVLTAPKSLTQNVANSLNRNNIDVEGFISSTYASGLSVLLDEELSSGVTLIDMGGSITSIASFYEGQLVYLDHIPVGGQNVTNDISMILRTTRSHAERLKILYGVATGGSTSDEEQILVPRIDEYGEEHIQNISKNTLDTIIRARLEEIIELVQNKLYSHIQDSVLTQRIVITGGASLISGLNELIKSNRNFAASSIRLGKPIGSLGSHDFVQKSSFSSSAGTILYGLGNFMNSSQLRFSQNINKSFMQKLLTWFRRGV